MRVHFKARYAGKANLLLNHYWFLGRMDSAVSTFVAVVGKVYVKILLNANAVTNDRAPMSVFD